MTYQCEATCVAGFVQQLAVGYITNGYYFYVSGRIPEEKNPTRTDEKIIKQYDIDVSKWTRARRKKAGRANVQYLRYRHQYVILANHGEHPFFEEEGRRLRDVRVYPFHFMGYSIGCRPGRNGGGFHASVRIGQDAYRELKSRFERLAVQRDTLALCRQFRAIPFESYAPVRDQLRCILRSVNRLRKAAGLEQLPAQAVFRERRQVKPFVRLAA